MTSKGYEMILEAARAAGLTNEPGAKPSPATPMFNRAERDEVAYVPHGDPAMEAAFRKARAKLPGFLALAKVPLAGMEGFAVKVAIADGCDTEYFWIHPFTQTGEQFSGRLNNTPSSSTLGLQKGDSITFIAHDIVDWTYVERGAMRGNYTARALLKNASQAEKDAFKRQFGLDGDL
jgi:uncharacterized protein YegJ (DUF2314 family)